MNPLRSGELFANRFAIDRTAGSGGMGTVYRARDRYSGDYVALKLLQHGGADGRESERFAREAQLLAELRHPNIVAYVAHGMTGDGQRYLAMEWLDGHDFAQRLAQGPLTLAETLLLIQRVAEALRVAHAHGVIHRDIKPSNLFLPAGDLNRVKLLDFGVARRLVSGMGVTRTGIVVGTPEYMAPEQARGVRDLTPAADLFSLGCVFYECLAGEPPFIAEHVAAVLVRILFEDPVPLASKRLGLPDEVCSLVEQLLRKDPGQRTRDAQLLLQQLPQLSAPPGLLQSATLALPRQTPQTFSEVEQALFSLVVAAPHDGALATAPSLPEEARQTALRTGLLAALRAMGLHAEFLVDQALVATVSQLGSATDQAAIAARAALVVKEHWPEAAVAVATGRGALAGSAAVGEVADRAARLLQLRASQPAASPAESNSGVWLDDLTARLLGPRFHLATMTAGTLLLGEEKSVDESRRLLGKPTQCVGRDAELSMLEAQLDGSILESEACAVLISANPGVGKSRLRHEFLRRIESRSEPVTVLSGRGDMIGAGAPYGIVATIIRGLCGLSGSEPIEVAQRQLTSRIARHVTPEHQDLVRVFLGELCNLPFSAETRPLLQEARRDPKLLRDCIRRAWLALLQAECTAAPVLLVVDDLHWGDGLTVSLFDETLRQLHDSPLFVLAFARPIITEVFPHLWQERNLQVIPLRPLSKKACERLIVQVLGTSIPGKTVAQAIEQSAGNALFLEELIRSIAEGKVEEQSATVIAMLQARIGRLEPRQRRTVRAAAVFGQTFWRGGVAALLGLDKTASEVDDWLSELLQVELIQSHPSSRLVDEQEFGFRHALVRDAAYSLLLSSDLSAGHRLAGEFLEAVGEQDAGTIADHFVQGGELARAVTYYLRAGDSATRLFAYSEARRHFSFALTTLQRLPQTPPVKRQRVDTLLQQVRAAHIADQPRQNLERLAEASALLDELGRDSKASDDVLRLAWVSYWLGRIHYYAADSRTSLRYCQQALDLAREHNHLELQTLASAGSGTALFAQGRLDLALPLVRSTIDSFAEMGRGHEWVRAVGHHGFCLIGFGHVAEGMSLLHQVHARALEIDKPITIAMTHLYYSLAGTLFGDWPLVVAHAQTLWEVADLAGERLYQYLAFGYLAWAQNQLGRPDEALRYYRSALETAEALGGRLLFGHLFAAVHSDILLNSGQLAVALAQAQEQVAAAQKAETCNSWGMAERTWGVALHRSGEASAAEVDGHLQASIQAFSIGTLVLDAAHTRLGWAEVCQQRGEHQRARTLLDHASAQFEAAGCTYAARCAQKLRQSWEGPRGEPDGC